MSDTQRDAALSRITDWMTAMDDVPDGDAAELIDAPYGLFDTLQRPGRVLLRSAAGTHLGLWHTSA
jgi:hypothetical protein